MGRQGDRRSAMAMLSVPPLWTVIVINFLALGLVWAYVMRCYPTFDAARFWTSGALAAAAGAAVSMLIGVVDSRLPLVGGGTLMILAFCLCAMGVKRFYAKPGFWGANTPITPLHPPRPPFFISPNHHIPIHTF